MFAITIKLSDKKNVNKSRGFSKLYKIMRYFYFIVSLGCSKFYYFEL